MKRLVSAVALGATAISCPLFAAPGFHAAGPNLTDGGASSAWTSLYATRNPAGGELAIAPDATLRVGLLSSVGVSMEVGPVDNFAEEIDDLIDELDRDDISLGEGEDLVERFNGLLRKFGQDGYLKVQGGVQIPLFPILVRSELGVFTADANIAGQARVGLLDAPLVYNSVSDQVETASAAYVKGAKLGEFSLGFSREVWKNPAARLIAGGRLRYLHAELSKQVVALESVEDGDEIEDVLRDTYDANEKTSSQVTADLGLVYVRSNYRAGLTLSNLTEPEFEYGAIGVNCAALTGSAQYNCFSAAHFSNRIALNETWKLERQATLEGAMMFADGRGNIAATVDLDDVHDPVGDLQQGLTAAVGYNTRTPWLPGVRLGYRKNLAGTKLSSVSAGVTFFDRVHLDAAIGLKSTNVDGNSVPRTMALNLGFETRY